MCVTKICLKTTFIAMAMLIFWAQIQCLFICLISLIFGLEFLYFPSICGAECGILAYLVVGLSNYKGSIASLVLFDYWMGSYRFCVFLIRWLCCTCDRKNCTNSRKTLQPAKTNGFSARKKKKKYKKLYCINSHWTPLSATIFYLFNFKCHTKLKPN